jgi:hypothetical protein
MKELVVQIRMKESYLKGFQTLAKLDQNSVGNQIRTAIEEYLKKREVEIQEVKETQDGEAKTLRNLIAVVKFERGTV